MFEIQKPVIFLDLDGVVVDFMGGVERFFGIDLSNHQKWEFDYKEQFGMSADTFWNMLGIDFWVNLEFEKWGKELIRLLEPLKPCILSKPTSGTASGKQEWIKRNLPSYWREKRWLLGPNKNFCAHQGAILIDDREEHVDEFIAYGGNAILFPRRWNCLRELEPVAVQHTMSALLELT